VSMGSDPAAALRCPTAEGSDPMDGVTDGDSQGGRG